MRFLFGFLGVLLVGCAAIPERPAVENRETAWAARRAALGALSDWELRGRLALRTEDEGAHATIRWKRVRDDERVDLAGPFGGGRVRITQNGQTAELRDASGKIYRDASLEDLLARVTGWRVPIGSLRYWIVGIPEPSAASQLTIDAWGRLQTLEQSGWEVQFLEYAPQDAFELPRRLFIKRIGGAPDRFLEVRFVVDAWSLNDARANGVSGNIAGIRHPSSRS